MSIFALNNKLSWNKTKYYIVFQQIKLLTKN